MLGSSPWRGIEGGFWGPQGATALTRVTGRNKPPYAYPTLVGGIYFYHLPLKLPKQIPLFWRLPRSKHPSPFSKTGITSQETEDG